MEEEESETRCIDISGYVYIQMGMYIYNLHTLYVEDLRI
jgi:hypothetical protein